jgi:ATP-binding protein involved in chromosome partitioning
MPNGRLTAARQLVENYVEPYLGMPLIDAKAVKSVQSEGETVRVDVELGFPLGEYRAELVSTLERRLNDDPVVAPARVEAGWHVPSQAVQGGLQPLPGIGNVIAVASGKGGVGKSTVAANLAVALAVDGARVGLLDADIYGPSQPRMMGVQGQRPVSRDGKKIEPLVAHGVRVMSIGFLVEDEQPMVWRGPMVTQALVQLLSETLWGELDYLVVDMPPGTGDIQLTLSQRVPVSGAVIVTTPQDIALLDAARAACRRSPFLSSASSKQSTHVFEADTRKRSSVAAARRWRASTVALLGQIPPDIRSASRPTAGGRGGGRAWRPIANATSIRGEPLRDCRSGCPRPEQHR